MKVPIPLHLGDFGEIIFDIIFFTTIAIIIITLVVAIINITNYYRSKPIKASVRHTETSEERQKTENVYM